MSYRECRSNVVYTSDNNCKITFDEETLSYIKTSQHILHEIAQMRLSLQQTDTIMDMIQGYLIEHSDDMVWIEDTLEALAEFLENVQTVLVEG